MSPLSEEHHHWLGALMDRIPAETPMVAAIHHPDMLFWWFPELFSGNLRLVISGHYHTHQTFWQGDTLHSSPSAALMAGSDGFPPAYRRYHMPASDDDAISYETINVNPDPALRKILIKRDDRLGGDGGDGPLEYCWHQRLDGAIQSGMPAIAGECIVVAPYDLDVFPIGRLQVFDVATGKLRWQRRLGDGFLGTPTIGAAGIPYLGPDQRACWDIGCGRNPTPVDHHVFVQSVTGRVYCISLSSGNTVWEQSVGQSAGRACRGRVVMTDELVLAGDSTCFAAFGRFTGQQQWLWPEDPLARVGSFTTASTAVGDGVVLVGSAYEDQGVLALAVSDGRMCWSSGDRKRARSGHCVFADGCFYFFGPHELICMEAATGAVRWRTACAEWSGPEPLVTEERVFGATSRNSLLALDKFTGARLWEVSLGSSRLTVRYNATTAGGQLAGPVAYGALVLLAGADGILYAVDAETGVVNWQHDFGIPLTSAPVVRGDQLFIITPDATLWRFQLP